MADHISDIRKLFADKQVPLSQSDVWEVQGVAVVKHKALERLAASLDIEWREPKILRAERDEAAILVTAAIGAHLEWSIGEAKIVHMNVDTGRKNKWGKPVYEASVDAIGNYQITPKQSAYLWAMAEKRGKDRVIIKLAGLDAFSEEESDDFKGRQEDRDSAPANESPHVEKPTEARSGYYKIAADRIRSFESREALNEWWVVEKENRTKYLTKDQSASLLDECRSHGEGLGPQQKSAA